jgi:hypothetical protein
VIRFLIMVLLAAACAAQVPESWAKTENSQAGMPDVPRSKSAIPGRLAVSPEMTYNTASPMIQAQADTNSILIEPASPSAGPHLGFGWCGQPEYADGREFKWIDRLEADVWFESDATRDTAITFMAAPLYIHWRRQVIGVYINNHFVNEWLCPDRPDFQEYRLEVPAALLQPGRNRLTFRMAYRRRNPPDRRELALAVHRIFIAPQEPPPR